ncbi:hypothetical protein CTAYLR_003509 [Chrysophaeum taylorii]|uniref:Methyltransferase n=1 Tax=Chrysophaeum taylorii TaxID=2483200 RepID=A0AAD7XHX6_9STRA|nr:hypothetical protein CTAYLR_003509 [Chrysophaeum taylorii]
MKVVAAAGVGVGAVWATWFVGTVWFPGKYDLDNTRRAILEQFNTYYGSAASWGGTDTEHDPANNRDAAERYFTLTTDFLEWGWGDAFHMAPVRAGWTFLRSMAFWETVFAGPHLGIKPGMKVADLGMGIGGPARRLVEHTGAFIEGVTNCKYQLGRAAKITSGLPEWHRERLKYIDGDYNALPASMERGSYDRVYFMESLSHCEDRSKPLEQARLLLKPGGLVGAWQWMLTPKFNYSDPVHVELKRGMEYGGGLRNLNKPEERIREMERAGLEVIESWDMGDEGIRRGHKPWWVPLAEGHDFFTKMRSSHVGRKLTMATVWLLETLRVAEKGTYNTALMMEHCGYSAATAGQLGVFTPMWVMIAKPKES